MSLELLELLAGMAQLMSLPDWLLAPLRAENFIDALRLQVAEFASGEWQCGDHCRANRLPARSKVDAASHDTREIKPGGAAPPKL